MKKALLRFNVFLFLDQTQWSAGTQHGTLPVVSPGSIHMNTSIENIVRVHRVN